MRAPDNTIGHPVVELLGRYRAIFRATWDARHQLAGPKRLADEAAFLPAALSLQDTPVHPAPRRTMWLIMALIVIALVWSIVGQVDIVAVAPGRIIVSERTKPIQPLEASVVSAVHVKDGDKVKAGQVLIELDATAAKADGNRVAQESASAESELRRTGVLIAALERNTQPQAQAGWDDTTRAQLASEWADITSKLAKLEAEQMHRRAEAVTLEQQIGKIESTLPLVRQREDDFKALAEQGFMSSHAGQDRTRERIELERDLATARAKRAETQAALRESEAARTAYRAETMRTLRERASQANLKHSQLGEEAAKAVQRKQLTRLTAPVAGTVQQLAVHTAGGVVTPAQVLMVVVPDDAEVSAEVTLANLDIGFVREGQVAEVKLETFAYTRYGTVPATVTTIAADAVNDEKLGALFPATLKLTRDVIDVDGKKVRLAPGMNLTAEIKTGRRRVIEYLLSPVQRHVDESIKER